MKRKLVSLLMVTAMAATMLAGCGGSDAETNTGDDAAANQEQQMMRHQTMGMQQQMQVQVLYTC